MELLGVRSPPDIYTIAVGLYVLWLLGRFIRAITFCSRAGLNVLLRMWMLQVII